jgi:hypothetical protein
VAATGTQLHQAPEWRLGHIAKRTNLAVHHAGLRCIISLIGIMHWLHDLHVLFRSRAQRTKVQSNVAMLLQVFVCVWPGDDMARQTMHPPFNLCVRLLLELACDVLVPVSAKAAAALDMAHTPFSTGTGYVQKFSVQKRTAQHTGVRVRERIDSISMALARHLRHR